MELTLSGPFREVVGLRSYNIVKGDRLDRNKAIDIRELSIFGGGRLERFYCICSMYMYKYVYISKEGGGRNGRDIEKVE